MIMLFLTIHTWVEYINRLGALAGIACIITFILSFGYRRKQKLILLTFLICVLMVFKLGWEKRLLTLF
jgi:cytochrome c oxidase assembly protein subunit 15